MERKELLMRILVSIVSGILLSVWLALVKLLFVINFFIVLISGKRNKGLAEFCEIWNTQTYVFLRYITFVSNKRPFPFEPLENSFSEFDG